MVQENKEAESRKGELHFLVPLFSGTLFTLNFHCSISCVSKPVSTHTAMRVGVVARQPFICYIHGYMNLNIYSTQFQLVQLNYAVPNQPELQINMLLLNQVLNARFVVHVQHMQERGSE